MWLDEPAKIQEGCRGNPPFLGNHGRYVAFWNGSERPGVEGVGKEEEELSKLWQ